MGPAIQSSAAIDRVSEEIRRLVDEFYVRVRADAVLGPIFARAIPGDWGRISPPCAISGLR